MRKVRWGAAAAGIGAAMLAAGAAQADPSVEFKDAAVRVVVIPEARSDVKVEVIKTNPRLPIQVRVEGDRTVVDGGLGWERVRGCRGSGGRLSVSIRGVGDVPYEDLPQVVVRTPMTADVGAGGAVFGSVGRSDALELHSAGCGDWTLGNVRGRLRVSQAGSGDTQAGSAGEVDLRVAGSGDISVREVSGPVNVNIAGSGDVAVASASSAATVSIAGSGDAKIGGHVTDARVRVAGSGGTWFNGQVDNLDVSIAGSGDVRVAQLRGALKQSVVGSGEVRIGR
ncbi:hypothetical protein C5708_03820 [Caulobacter sp. CCUG 60055]|uniref:GIN domain-containing protein n=1 Tax=Caulobacter sp. CCUG 60055 TaxID=2100090 RepID=UPI001FA7BBEA|nr:DUF2807 domain-containing protein [Caulobacter sp. CCUG 60055]MBQ1540753.1 DUF2807 domain-containing protein [Caulobacteraceae bacterium]MCI3179375.1 hypothetical protein [Caulobacter sp. CCUG 60055]